MSRRRALRALRAHLTYANVMSSLAVFLLLGGGAAFAATKIGSDQIKAGAITGSKIKREAVGTAKLKRDAVTGAKVKEATLGQVPKAAFALAAGSAPPRAYAKVLHASAGGGVDEALAKGIADGDVSFVGGSVYCFELGFAPRNAQATVEWIGGGAASFAQADVGHYPACPAGTDATVRTTTLDREAKGVGSADIDFFVSFVG